MKFIFGFIAIATSSVTGSIEIDQSSIKRETTEKFGLGSDEIVSNDATEIMVHGSGTITFFMEKPRENLWVIGKFGKEMVKTVADSIEIDFKTIEAAMKLFDPNTGDDSVREKVSADVINRAYAGVGVKYVAYVDESSKSEVLVRYSSFRFNCVSDKRTINEYLFQKREIMPSVAVKAQQYVKGTPEYEAGFRQAQEAATKHCQSVYKLVSSAPSLKKAVLGLDH